MTRSPDPIDAYLARLRAALAFDPALAARAADEIEAHLRDAAEAIDGDAFAAQTRVIARFGAPEAVAAQFARELLPSRLTAFWPWLLGAAVSVFVAMRLRRMLGESMETADLTLVAIGAFVDRWFFIAALIVAGAAWLSAGAGERPTRLLGPLALAVGAMALSALGGLTMLAASGGAPGAASAAMAVAFVLLGLVAARLIGLERQARSARALTAI